MASGVNVKMGVSGIAQFKQNINQAKQSVKTLDAQLALTEKQFKASGDAESYMTEKAELLKAKLEAQKGVLANAEKALEDMASKGVDRASKAYQDMYRQMLQAKGEMLDTENAMNGVADAGEEAANGVDAMNNQLKRVGDGVSFQNVTTSLGKITSGLERAAQKAVTLGKKIVSAMLGAGSYADELKTNASAYGLTTEQLQRMEKTSTIIDTSVESIIGAQKKLKKGLGSADKGVMGAFVELLGEGYDVSSKGWEDAFWDAGEALTKFTDEEEKEVYAQKLFGKSWNDLMPLFEAGRKEYEETNASWKVLSDEQIESLGKMDDEYQKLQQTVENLKLEILSNFAEPMAKTLETITGKLNEFTEWLDSEEGKQYVDNVVMVIQGALEWIANPENINTVVGGLGAIVAGWAGLKLTGGALQILQLVNGINGLRGKAATVGAGAGGAGGASGFGSAAGAGVTTAASKIAGFAGAGGLIPAVLADRFLNETNAGRALRDGGDFWQGITQDFQDTVNQLNENVATFADNWDPNSANANVIAKFFGRRDENQDAAERLGTANWLPSYMGGGIGNGSTKYEEAAGKMEKAAEEMTGGTDKQKQSSTEMTAAAGTLKGMPAEVYNAILRGFSNVKIYIDGQQAGSALTPYVNSQMGGILASLTK